jgi:hypothetical protein
MDAPANIADLEYKGAQAIGNALQWRLAFPRSRQGPPLPEWARPGQALNAAQDEAEQKDLGYLPEAANGPQRYAGAVVRLGAGSAIPAAKLAGLGKGSGRTRRLTGAPLAALPARRRMTLPRARRGPGQGPFPWPSCIGSVAGGASRRGQAHQRRRGSSKRVNDPRTPFLGQGRRKDGPGRPRSRPQRRHAEGSRSRLGRANQLHRQKFLNEVEPRLADMDLDPVRRPRFRAAIKRRADLTPDEIAALEGTPAGDAVAEGIRMFQATRDLTPGYNGYKPGPIRRGLEMGLSVAGAAHFGPFGALVGPIVRRVIRGDPADLNMSRLDAGAKALKRKDAWAKLGQQTGADSVGTKTADFIKAHDDLQGAKAAEADAAAQAKQACYHPTGKGAGRPASTNRCRPPS